MIERDFLAGAIQRLSPMSQTQIAARDLHRILPGSTRTHQGLLEAVLHWCELHKIPAVPVHTGPRVAPRAEGGFELRGNPGQHGLADVLAILPPFGRAALVEVKTGRARKSGAQVDCHRRLGAAGALSVTIRNLEEMQQLLYQVAADRAIAALARGERRQA